MHDFISLASPVYIQQFHMRAHVHIQLPWQRSHSIRKFLSDVVGIPLDKHLGGYTLGENLFGKVFY